MTRPRFGLAMGGKYNIRPPPSKRGGSDPATDTRDASLFPTAPPQSSYKSGVPKIGGSEGGFIGLIVGLGVLILLCICAVYYLLRTRPHGGRAGNKNYPRSTHIPAPTGLFASRRHKGAGWVQQGDEFDYDSAEDEDLVNSGKTRGTYGEGGTGYIGRPSQVVDVGSSPAAEADAYTDPFDPERLPESVRRQQAPLPLTTHSSHKERPYSATSTNDTLKQSPTTPTFEGGTKFKEQF